MFRNALPRSAPLASPAAVALAIALALAGCGKAPETTLPERPQGTGTATLSWVPPAAGASPAGAASATGRIVGYRIYVGPAPEALRPEAVVADPQATRYVVRKLPKGTHYFAVRSYDAEGVESDATAVVSKTID